MPGLNKRTHFPIEEGHEQAGDMRPIDIGIGHNNDPLVAQLIKIKGLTHPAAQR